MIIQQKTFAEVVKRLIEARLVDVHTSLPARVVAYDRASRTASVQPLIRAPQRRETGTTMEAMPVLTRVPVMFHATSRNGITFPLQAGDLVWVMFSESSLERVSLSEGDITDPKTPIRFTLAGAVCLPGFHTTRTVDDESDDDAMVVHGDEIRLGSKSASEKVALVPGVQQAIAGIMADQGVVSAQAALAAAMTSGVGVPAAQLALEGAIETYFTAHPVQGAQKVEAE